MGLLSGFSASFNTQPPEGGWVGIGKPLKSSEKFQHTAARRRLVLPPSGGRKVKNVSTHSRPKAAGFSILVESKHYGCFNTQPPEGGWHSWEDMHEWLKWFQHTAARRRLDIYQAGMLGYQNVSTHSRPKAAGS